MPPTCEETFDFDLPFEQTVMLAKQVLWDMGANIRPVDPEPGIVLGRTGMSLRSWGENIRVKIVPLGKGCKVQIQSRSSWVTTLIDWGKNAENVARFQQGLSLLSGDQ